MITRDFGALIISEELWRRIVDYYRSVYEGVHPRSFPIEAFAAQRLEGANVQLNRLRSLRQAGTGRSLDAGCGIGAFAALASLHGYDFSAYDVDAQAVEIARNLFEENGLQADRVRLMRDEVPFSDLFDLITSFQVAEHVTDLDSYLSALRKAVAPFGVLFIEAPNYLIPYETHFYVLWMPGPPSAKWLVCRLMGRTNRHFFDTLNPVTPRRMRKALVKADFDFVDLGSKEWVGQLCEGPDPVRSRYMKVASHAVRRLKLESVARWTARAGLFTPLVYLARPASRVTAE